MAKVAADTRTDAMKKNLAEAIAHGREKEVRDRQRDFTRQQHGDIHAGLLAFLLRREGKSFEEAAAIVMARYPHTVERLKAALAERDRERLLARKKDDVV